MTGIKDFNPDEKRRVEYFSGVEPSALKKQVECEPENIQLRTAGDFHIDRLIEVEEEAHQLWVNGYVISHEHDDSISEVGLGDVVWEAPEMESVIIDLLQIPYGGGYIKAEKINPPARDSSEEEEASGYRLKIHID